MEELVKEIFDLKNQKEKMETELQEKETYYKAIISDLDSKIELKEKDLLTAMKTLDNKEVEVDNLVATYFSKENVSYTSDSDVLNYLKENNYTTLINSKTTESLNKNALKKALKTDLDLSKALEKLTIKTVTEYVVVTTKENHIKMLEHIDNNKKGK